MPPGSAPLDKGDKYITGLGKSLEHRVEKLESHKHTHDKDSLLVKFLIESFPQTKWGNILFWSIPICLTGLALFLF